VNTIYDSLLDSTALNTIIYDDPYAKLCLVSTIILQLREEQRKKVLYIDFDTVFTAFVKAGLIPPLMIKKRNSSLYSSDILRIYIPNQKIDLDVIDVIKHIDEASIVIFDSITSFYSLFYFDLKSSKTVTRELGNINHLLLIILMLLLKNTRFSKIPLLVTSMIRFRKDVGWIRMPTSNRFLQSRSKVNLYVRMENENDMSISVLSHPRLTPQTMIFLNSAIKLGL
jgi:hypothetical protein